MRTATTHEAKSLEKATPPAPVHRVPVVAEMDPALGNWYAEQTQRLGCVQRAVDGSCSGCCGACRTVEQTSGTQASLEVSTPNDPHEIEADHIADQIVQRADAPEADDRPGPVVPRGEPAPIADPIAEHSGADGINRKADGRVSAEAAATLDSTCGTGRPLPGPTLRRMENAFGADFTGVRIHTDAAASTMSRLLAAHAFTLGNDIYFNTGKFDPDNTSGQHLLAHELTHTLQQRAGSGRAATSSTPTPRSPGPSLVVRPQGRSVLQCVPGDGLLPPGDCGWLRYVPLRLSVESAKAIVNMLGSCTPTDSCTLLAAKIAAITAEIAARVALDTTCFRGGDTGHRQQVQDKINMVNRCYRFFEGSNCPQGLVEAMAVVVASARTVVEAAAIAAAEVVVIAAVVALIAAIIALVEIIAAAAAAAAAAAEAALVAVAARALVALLAEIQAIL
jgi:hypothetical protein